MSFGDKKILHEKRQQPVKTGSSCSPGLALMYSMVQWKLFDFEQYYSGQLQAHLLLMSFKDGSFYTQVKIQGVIHKRRLPFSIFSVFSFQYTVHICYGWNWRFSLQACMWGLVASLQVFRNWHDGTGSPGTGVTDLVATMLVLRTETESPARGAMSLHHWAISSLLISFS